MTIYNPHIEKEIDISISMTDKIIKRRKITTMKNFFDSYIYNIEGYLPEKTTEEILDYFDGDYILTVVSDTTEIPVCDYIDFLKAYWEK
jgi:hypothetical protein